MPNHHPFVHRDEAWDWVESRPDATRRLLQRALGDATAVVVEANRATDTEIPFDLLLFVRAVERFILSSRLDIDDGMTQDAMDLNNALEQLTNAVRRLAAPADEQLAALDRLGLAEGVDELALELDDTLPVVRGQWPDMPGAVRDAFERLDGQLSKMSDDPGLWTREALCTSPAWTEVRRLATVALGEMRRSAPF